ncbi:hypothetical protein Avbf_15383, partial [Armadillidium vulgare]
MLNKKTKLFLRVIFKPMMILTCLKICLAYLHLHFTLKKELFSEMKSSRMMNVLENIYQELYHLIIQQKKHVKNYICNQSSRRNGYRESSGYSQI